jgi:hypothetical protein
MSAANLRDTFPHATPTKNMGSDFSGMLFVFRHLAVITQMDKFF